MSETSVSSLFTQQLFKIDLTLTPKEFGKNLDEKFLSSLKSRVEGKILLDKGFIENDSVDILKRTSGQIEDNTFTGNIVSRVIYQANVCNPAIGSVIKARIKNVNNLGFLALNGPLYIIIPREIHKNLDLFTNYNRGDDIDIRIIKKEFNFKQNYINIVGQLEEDMVNTSKKITFKKKMNNKENSKTEISEVSEITELDDGTKNVVNIDDETEDDGGNVLENDDEDEESVQDQEDFGEEEDAGSDFELDDGDDYDFDDQGNEEYE